VRKTKAYYPLVVQSRDKEEKYGFRVCEDGTIEYLGNYYPSGRTRKLYNIMGRLLAVELPRRRRQRRARAIRGPGE